MAKLFLALWPCQSRHLFLGRCELCHISVMALLPILVGTLQDRVLLNRSRLQTLIPLYLIIFVFASLHSSPVSSLSDLFTL